MRLIARPLVAAIILAEILPVPAMAKDTDELVGTFNLCVRSMAARLEASGDEPTAVAEAAVFMCLPEEVDAVNSALKDQPVRLTPHQIRETAVFYGASQAVIARLCRKTKDCLVPAPYVTPRILDTR